MREIIRKEMLKSIIKKITVEIITCLLVLITIYMSFSMELIKISNGLKKFFTIFFFTGFVIFLLDLKVTIDEEWQKYKNLMNKIEQ